MYYYNVMILLTAYRLIHYYNGSLSIGNQYDLGS